MTSIVAGHPLPRHLGELLRSGDWPPSNAANATLSPPIEDIDDLTWLDLRQMEANTQAIAAAVARGEGAVLSLTDQLPIPAGCLHVSALVVIGVTYGQEVVALHYGRPQPAEPRVVATSYTDHAIQWTEVASSFDDFAQRLGL